MGKTRVILSHQAGSVVLPFGETVVGRGLSCDIRFNDPGISRQHIRLTVAGDVVALEELRSTNGTRLNGKPFTGTKRLNDGDELQIGHRWLKVRIQGGEADDKFDAETIDRSDEWTAGEIEAPVAKALPILTEQNCPSCRELIPADVPICPLCDYPFPSGRPRSVTQQIRLQDIDRRSSPRHPVDIPLLYSSDTLTFDAVARDLSLGGIYVASELLDPVGTRCNVTILPDGSPPIAFAGVVCHVIEEETGLGGRPPGFGIKFLDMTNDTQRWLAGYLEQHPSA